MAWPSARSTTSTPRMSAPALPSAVATEQYVTERGARQHQDQAFWHIVQDLHWRLDDGSGGPPPPGESEFDHGGGGGVWPVWATHVIAFLLGGLTWARCCSRLRFSLWWR